MNLEEIRMLLTHLIGVSSFNKPTWRMVLSVIDEPDFVYRLR